MARRMKLFRREMCVLQERRWASVLGRKDVKVAEAVELHPGTLLQLFHSSSLGYLLVVYPRIPKFSSRLGVSILAEEINDIAKKATLYGYLSQKDCLTRKTVIGTVKSPFKCSKGLIPEGTVLNRLPVMSTSACGYRIAYLPDSYTGKSPLKVGYWISEGDELKDNTDFVVHMQRKSVIEVGVC